MRVSEADVSLETRFGLNSTAGHRLTASGVLRQRKPNRPTTPLSGQVRLYRHSSFIAQLPMQSQPQSPIFWSACELCDAASFQTPFSFTQVSVVRIVRERCSPLIIMS